MTRCAECRKRLLVIRGTATADSNVFSSARETRKYVEEYGVTVCMSPKQLLTFAIDPQVMSQSRGLLSRGAQLHVFHSYNGRGCPSRA
jgi:hypothetical protein